MGPGSDGPMGGLGGMESHHMNGSLGKDIKSDVQKWIQNKTLIRHIMIYKVLLCIGARFEMLQLLPTPDSLIHRIFAMMTGEHLKTQMCENCSIWAHIHSISFNLWKSECL